MTREELNREIVRALDDLVADAKYHGEQITASIARTEELSLRRRGEVAIRSQTEVARETPPPYGDASARFDRIEGRLDRIERTLADIRERMVTKVELEHTNENVKKIADAYTTIGQRLDAVAEMLKLRVVMP